MTARDVDALPYKGVTMGCGASQHRQPYDNTRQVHHDHQDSRSLVRLRDIDTKHTQRHSTRELQRVDVIKARRRESEAAISNLPKAPPKPEKLPYLKKRMSALMSPERDALKRDPSIVIKATRFAGVSRLAKLGLASTKCAATATASSGAWPSICSGPKSTTLL